MYFYYILVLLTILGGFYLITNPKSLSISNAILYTIVVLSLLGYEAQAKEYQAQFQVSPKIQQCINKHVRRIDRLNPDSSVKQELAKWLCVHLKPVERDYAISIAMVESNIEQINSRSGKDVGLYQIHVNEIKRRKLNRDLLEENVEYQTLVFRDILREKLIHCAKRYPFSAIACFHSATPKYHYRYFKRFEMSYSKIWRLR